jgi:hypothetical protein
MITGTGEELGSGGNKQNPKGKSNGVKNCRTVTCRAIQGDLISLIDILVPSHLGWRLQGEGTVSIGAYSPSFTIGLNILANRKSDEFAIFIDVAGEPVALGAGSPIGATVTTGLLVGWGSSTVKDVAQGDSYLASGTIAPDLAVSGAAAVPIEGNAVDEIMGGDVPKFHKDPVYGQVPVTLFGGGGIGAYYAGGGAGISRSLFSLSVKFP